MIVEPFAPNQDKIYRETVSSSSKPIAIDGNGDRVGTSVRISCSVTGDRTYLRWGPTTVIASATGEPKCMSMLASSVETFRLPPGTKCIAVVSPSGTGDIEITVGDGS